MDRWGSLEGYTNFLWVVLIGAIGLVTEDLIGAARALGLVTTGLAIVAVAVASRVNRFVELVAPAFAAFAVAASVSVATWAIGGLEQPLLAASLGWGFVFLRSRLDQHDPGFRELWPAGAALGLAAMTRPEGLLFTVGACAGVVLGRGFDRRALVVACRLAAIPVACCVALLVFRLFYYEAWVPNTFHARSVITSQFLNRGVKQLTDNFRAHLALVLPALAALPLAIFAREIRQRVLVTALPVVLWCAYFVLVGGDIQPQRRHMVPIAVLLALLAADTLLWLASRRRIAGPLLAWVVLPLLLAHAWIFQRAESARGFPKGDFWPWDAKPVGAFLNAHFRSSDPLLAIDPAGGLSYFSGLRTLDMLGLNDRWLAEHPPKKMGVEYPGHELGDADYFLRRAPDIIVFHYPQGQRNARWPGSVALQRKPEFRQLYQFVTFQLRGSRVSALRAWIRKHDGPLGARTDQDRIEVPGYLFTSNAPSLVTEDSETRLGTSLKPGEVVSFDGLAVGAGTWRILVEAHGDPSPELRVFGEGLSRGQGSTPFTLARPATGRIEVRAGERQAHLRRVVLERTP